MSWHKPKHDKEKSHTSPYQGSSQQDPGEGDVRVHGAIEVHPPQSLIQQHTAEREEDRTQGNKNYIVSKWTLIAVAIYAFLTLLLVLLSGMNNKTAMDAMRQSQRPWIGPDTKTPIIAGPIVIDDKWITTTYQMTAVSYGNYGANNVDFWAQLYVAQDISTINKRARYACDVATMNPDLGMIMFPGQARVMSNPNLAFVLDMVPNMKVKPPQKEIQAYLLTCIGYRDQFQIPHHTGTIYKSVRPQDSETVMFDPTIKQTIPVEWKDWHSFLD